MQLIFPDIHRVKMPPFGPPAWEVSNVYFVGKEEAVIVDAGYPTKESADCILDAWNELDRPKINAILITHAHHDHVGALGAVSLATGAPVYAHENEIGIIKAMSPDVSVNKIADKDEFHVGDITLKALHVPGHTTGHTCFFIESRGLLLTGDHIVGQGYAVIVPPQGDMKLYMEWLYRFKTFDLKKILPGHGPVVDDPQAKINEYIDHRKLREIQILRQLQNSPKNISEMAEDIYAGIHPILRHAGRYQILAHLIKMEPEKLVAAVSGSGDNVVYRSLVGKLPF